MRPVDQFLWLELVLFSASTLLVGWQEGHLTCKKRATYLQTFASRTTEENNVGTEQQIHLENGHQNGREGPKPPMNN